MRLRIRSFRARIAALMLLLAVISYAFIYLLYKVEEDEQFIFHFVDGEDIQAEVGQYPILVWWTPFTGEHGRHKRCGKDTCYFTDDRKFFTHDMTGAFLFYGTDFKPTDLPLPRSHVHDWALLHEESPKNNYLFSTVKVMELFNHTATFRETSDLPLVLQYLESLDVLITKKYYVPTEIKNKKLQDLSPIVYVHSDCDTPSDRDSYVRELMNFIKVDSYGKCLHTKDLPKGLDDPMRSMDSEEFLHILAQYKFNLAFENGVCDDYITEKLWRPLIVGSIPVYYGSPTIKTWLPNSNSAIIVNDFKGPKELADHLHHLNNDDVAYEKHLEHKLHHKISNDHLVKTMQERAWGINNDLEKGSFIDYFECLVCRRVGTNFRRRKKGLKPVSYKAAFNHYGCPKPLSPLTGEPDPRSWWLDQYNKAQYEAKALQILIDSGKNFSNTDFFGEVIRLLESEAEQ